MFICIWKSEVEDFDNSLKLLFTMGECFQLQVIAAFQGAQVVRDSVIPRTPEASNEKLIPKAGFHCYCRPNPCFLKEEALP